MEQETKQMLTKVLMWGGGGLLAFMGLIVIWKIILGILGMPLWIPLFLGGGGYYAYRKLKKGKPDREDRW